MRRPAPPRANGESRWIDHAHASADEAERARARAFVDFMVPIHEGWATEASIDVANLAIQVHGG